MTSAPNAPAATIRDAHRPTMRTHRATTTAERALVHRMLR
jgi:hypothetical protein